MPSAPGKVNAMHSHTDEPHRARAERREYRATFSHPEGWHPSDAHLELLVRALDQWDGRLTGRWELPGSPPYLELWFTLPSVESLGALRSRFLPLWKECLAGGQGDVRVSFRSP
jgi:hypothetical protein